MLMDYYSRLRSYQSSRHPSSSLLKQRIWRRLSSSDLLRKRKVEVDRLVRSHCKNGECNERVVDHDGCCVRGSGRTEQRKMFELRYCLECLWVTMPKLEVSLYVGDG